MTDSDDVKLQRIRDARSMFKHMGIDPMKILNADGKTLDDMEREITGVEKDSTVDELSDDNNVPMFCSVCGKEIEGGVGAGLICENGTYVIHVNCWHNSGGFYSKCPVCDKEIDGRGYRGPLVVYNNVLIHGKCEKKYLKCAR